MHSQDQTEISPQFRAIWLSGRNKGAISGHVLLIFLCFGLTSVMRVSLVIVLPHWMTPGLRHSGASTAKKKHIRDETTRKFVGPDCHTDVQTLTPGCLGSKSFSPPLGLQENKLFHSKVRNVGADIHDPKGPRQSLCRTFVVQKKKSLGVDNSKFLSVKFGSTPPPPHPKKTPNEEKLCKISRKSSKLTLLLGGGGDAILWTNDSVHISGRF